MQEQETWWSISIACWTRVSRYGTYCVWTTVFKGLACWLSLVLSQWVLCPCIVVINLLTILLKIYFFHDPTKRVEVIWFEILWWTWFILHVLHQSSWLILLTKTIALTVLSSLCNKLCMIIYALTWGGMFD